MLTRHLIGGKRVSYKYRKEEGEGETYEDGSNWRYWLLFKNVCGREWAGGRKAREKDREEKVQEYECVRQLILPHEHRKSKWSKIFITVSRDKRRTDVLCIVLFLISCKFEIISK